MVQAAYSPSFLIIEFEESIIDECVHQAAEKLIALADRMKQQEQRPRAKRPAAETDPVMRQRPAAGADPAKRPAKRPAANAGPLKKRPVKRTRRTTESPMIDWPMPDLSLASKPVTVGAHFSGWESVVQSLLVCRIARHPYVCV